MIYLFHLWSVILYYRGLTKWWQKNLLTAMEQSAQYAEADSRMAFYHPEGSYC